MDAPMSRLRDVAVQGATRRALALPVVRVALAVAAGLLVLPLYFRWFAYALGQCGAGFWAPVVR